MIKEKLMKMKDEIKNKDGSSNNKKIIENLVMFIIILIITVVIINYIWKDDKNKNIVNENSTNVKVLADENTTSTNSDDISSNLENILSKIKGVGKVKVLITYSQTSQNIPMYSEDSSQKTTEENDSRGRN